MRQVPIISAQPHAIRGGPAIQHLAFLRHLQANGFDCHVVLPEGHEMESEYRAHVKSLCMVSGRLTVPRTNSPSVLVRYGAELTSSALQVAAYAKRTGARLIHTFGEGFLGAAVAARLARIPSVVHIVGMSIFEPRLIAWTYGSLLNLTADALVACQSQIVESLRSVGVKSRKVHLVYNCIDTDLSRSLAALGSSLEFESNTVRIGMVAGMDSRKGHLNLLRAARRICSQDPRARFFIVGSLKGDDAYLRMLRSEVEDPLLRERVTFVGPVQRVEPWTASFDIYCNPSSTEGLPVAGIEAMALGRPIVATRVGGNPDLVGNGEAGILCNPEDSDALAEAILQLMGDSGLREKLGAAARSRADALFGVGRNAQRLAMVFHSLI